MLGVNEFTYDAEEINETLLDEFGKYLIAKPNRFRSLGRVQEAMLKARVEKKPDNHPYVVHQEEAGIQEPQQGTKLFGAIKSLFNKDK